MRSRLVVVVTDFDAHPLWLVPHVDRYFVALEETRRYLAELGVPAEQITVSGIPIGPVFTEPRNQLAMVRTLHVLSGSPSAKGVAKGFTLVYCFTGW